jgi:protein SCO1
VHTRRNILALTAAAIAAGAMVVAATWSAFRWGTERQQLPVLGTVPDFALVGSDGNPLSVQQLAGRAWVADFIFTRCPGMCPVLSAQMTRVQQALAEGSHSTVRLVSFSVDPKNDTPEALRAYAERFGADHDRWLFVTGNRDALYNLIHQGFHLAVAERAEGEATDGDGLITHSDRFVLVDPNLQIRGYYHGMDDADIQQLLKDIAKLHGSGS